MWVADLLDIVNTKVGYNLEEEYPGIICTTDNENVIPTNFPSVYIQELAPVEDGQDLQNLDTPFVIYTIQIKVWAKDEQDCKSISYSAIEQMKRMRFNVISFPDVQTKDNISSSVMRFRRIIGDGDSL